jgi:class 3 adenylate cyclase/tetratricopeptide (TPR) repeat protein/ABC-type transport system involved in cytochrome c biogenesis ATPase subunit
MDVGVWLRGLGLGQYEAAFRENEIGGDVLPNLTADDLKELGVTVVGHRRKLLTAIGSLGRPLPAFDVAARAPPPPPPLGDRHAQDTAERRQLTVMFCDLVGSTALSARLDPEDMREIVGNYHRSCAEQITKAGGFVAKYMGDGVLAYFGYPQAHEHDAERAVVAGLALAEAVPMLKTAAGTPLQVRVGIATGLVVVGDLIGSGDAQERGVVGDTPNLAARLQALAEPNMVVIADSTRKLLGNLFELRDLGPQYLKGIAGPTRAWAALRASSVESRFEALHMTGLAALVGREEEFEALLRRWSRAKSGEGQVVLISGEAGIGKSRLTAALLEGLAAESHTRLRYFCSPQHTDSALHPFIGQIERAAGLTYEDKPQTKLDKLDAALAQTSTSPEDAALFAEMLSLANDGRHRVQELSAEQRRQRTLEALSTQLGALARQHPVLMIFEDAHWADPTSLEVLGRTVDRIKTLPALMIVTFRPEFNAPWVGQSNVMSQTLNRLGEREAAGIIAGLIGNKNLPADVMAEIVERTDGIPLFVEEMTKAVLEAESEVAARRTVAAVPSSTLAVPASLHASLMARLDRLGPAKEVAQIGSAIGREFSHALLASVARKPDTELASALDRLVQAGLLFRQGVPPHASYLFKHALVQDAAYGTLLREKRRALHARIAETLESQFAETAEGRPEMLAHHFTEAGLTEAAIEWWGTAGQRSLARSALLEGGEQLKRALDQIATTPVTPALRREEIKLEVAFANALALTGDLMDGKEHYDRALAIYDPVEHRPLATRSGRDVGVALLSYRSACVWQLGYPAASRNDAARAVKNARESGHPTNLMYALIRAVRGYTWCGDYAAANEQLDELIDLADERGKALENVNRGVIFALTGKASDAIRVITAGITSLRSTGATLNEPWYLWHLAMAYAELYQLDDAQRCVADAMDKVERSKEKWCEAEVHRIAGEIALKSFAPDSEKAEKHFDRALAVARQQQAKSWELRAAMSTARLWRDRGKLQQARELLAPVYGWFTEGFDTLDLKDAKALLDELAT